MAIAVNTAIAAPPRPDALLPAVLLTALRPLASLGRGSRRFPVFDVIGYGSESLRALAGAFELAGIVGSVPLFIPPLRQVLSWKCFLILRSPKVTSSMQRVAVFCRSMHAPSIEPSPPNWVPLERNLKPPDCAEFMWVYREAGLDHYKHIETRKYLRLDGGGRCLVQAEDGWKEVPFEDEWKRVSGRS